MKRLRQNTEKEGFTLIELLVVIAIIAILAAILFPVFAKVREKARQASCQSNEKQIGIAILQYVEDYDEKYPGGAPGAVANAIPGMGWAGAISPYVKSVQVFECPDDVDQPGVYSGFTYYPISYGMNRFIGNVALAQVTSPSVTVLASEVGGAYAYLEYTDEGLKEVPGGYMTVSPITTGWPRNGCGNGCGGNDGAPGLDVYSGANVGGGNITGAAPSGAYDATAGQFARHNVQSTVMQGSSEYLLADGHVKFMHVEDISTGIHPVGNPNMGSLAATYAPGDANL